MEGIYIELVFEINNTRDVKLSPHLENKEFINNICKIKYLKEEMYFKVQDENQEITLKNVENFIKIWISDKRNKLNKMYSGYDDKINTQIKLIIGNNIYFKYNIKNEIELHMIQMLIGILKDIIKIQ